MLLSSVASHDMELHHIDIKTAFMNGDIEEELYMQPPPGWGDGSRVWRLYKGVNDLKQAARAWNAKLTDNRKKLGFVASRSDASLYISHANGRQTYILCYVDDLLIGGKYEDVIRTKQAIKNSFKCDDMGEANLFLGMNCLLYTSPSPRD